MSRDLELEKQIDAYIKGRLTEEEALQLWKKLLQRPDYIELLKTELGVKSIIENRSSDTLDGTPPAKESGITYSLNRSLKWMAAAAAIVILVVSVNILQVDTNQALKNSAKKSFNLAENLSSAQILRNQKSAVAPADSLLNRGFEAAISGEVSRALQMYNEIIAKFSDHPAAVQAYLNKGIIQYNNGKYGESAELFEAVLEKVGDKPILKEKAYWYLGNAYINIERLNDARKAIHRAYQIDGIYRKSAYRLLRKLDYELGNINFDDNEQ